jgi:hypothetical protein
MGFPPGEQRKPGLTPTRNAYRAKWLKMSKSKWVVFPKAYASIEPSWFGTTAMFDTIDPSYEDWDNWPRLAMGP